MSGTGLIKGLVEEGIRNLIKDEVKAKLNEMFPVSGKTYGMEEYQRRWRQEIENHSLEILKKDPEIQEMIKDQIVAFIKSGIAKVNT